MSKPPVIAIVDDDKAVRDALSDLLQVEGLTAHSFDSGAAFLEADAAESFDCLISDLRMPDIDGIELQRRLRARGIALPIIFITASTDEATRERAMRDGASAWLAKPVADEVLLGALWAVVGRAGAGDGREPPGD